MKLIADCPLRKQLKLMVKADITTINNNVIKPAIFVVMWIEK